MKTLYDHFCQMIDQSPKWNGGRWENDWSLPAFFFDNLEIYEYEPSDLIRPPFSEFWMVFNAKKFRTTAGNIVPSIGANVVALYVRDAGDGSYGYRAMAMRPSGKWARVDLRDDSKGEVGDYFSLIIDLGALRISSSERELIETWKLRSINAGRAKAKTPLKPIPNFIGVGGPLRVNARNDENAGTGKPRIPHQRRGHWRTLHKSGKQVWVRDCAIKGGCYVPRDYRVG